MRLWDMARGSRNEGSDSEAQSGFSLKATCKSSYIHAKYLPPRAICLQLFNFAYRSVPWRRIRTLATEPLFRIFSK